MESSGPWRSLSYLLVVTLCCSIQKVGCTMGRGSNCTGYMDKEAVAMMKEVVRSTPLMMASTRGVATSGNTTSGNDTSGNDTSSNDTQNATVNTCLGDILVTKRMANVIRKDMEKKSRVRRSIFDFSSLPEFKWELPIPYKIDPSFSVEQKQEIRKALQDWVSVTCVTFTELTAAETPSHFVEFKPGRGCISFVGRVANQPQPVFLEASCFRQRSQQLTITHEVGHVLGFWHTHQQPGRDAHVNILDSNIAEGEKGSFILLPDLLVVSANVTGYDHASIMHYDSQDLSRDNRRVLGTVDSLFQNTIGQRVRVSFLDAKTINNAYCSDRCAAVPLPTPCQHGGYQNPRDCITCICPDGWDGDQCQSLAKPQGDTCGGELMAASLKQVFSSPRHKLGPYPAGQQCTWRIKTSTSRNIKFRFVGEFGMYCTPFARTCHDWVEVRFRQTDQVLGPRFCCETPPRDTFTAETDEVLINFRVYSDSSSYSRRPGFSIEYFVDAVRCDPNPCQNGGSCLPEGSAVCQCTEGYTGDTCDQPIPLPCDLSPCENGGTCNVGDNGNVICSCANGYSGDLCQTALPCDSSPCENGGTCNVGDNGNVICSCANGYSGDLCQTAVPGPCDAGPCENEGTCMVSGQNFFCVCPTGYRGFRCEVAPDPCDSLQCRNGVCTSQGGVASCVCHPGYTGALCNTDVNECESTPCRNGGTCMNFRNAYRCRCQRPFSGINCETGSTNACSSNPCQQGGRCMSTGSAGYYCICPRGRRGRNCESGAGSCASSPCLNGGTCRSSGRSYRCTCTRGYTGPRCNTGTICIPNPCTNSGTCIQFRGRARCLCPLGRGGGRCEQVTNACHSNPCTGTQRCMPLTDNRYRCVCPTGQSCDPVGEPTPCSSSPCGNRGQCVDQNTGFTCNCHRGFTGTTCENTTMCNPNPCKNGGTCQVRGATYQCMCPPGLSGRQCQQGSCGACGETAGSVCEPCMRYHTTTSTCSHTISYTTHTSFLIFFRRTVTRTRRVYRSCPTRTPLWDTASCCDNAKLITDMRGAKKCVVEGWQPFGECDGRCGGCGHSSRRGYTVSYNNRGRGLLTARLESRVCNTAVCESCSWSDWVACRCDTPCCHGMRRVGNQCVPTGAP